MSKKIVKESFPGQPEDKDISTGVSVPFKQANKEHDENIKDVVLDWVKKDLNDAIQDPIKIATSVAEKVIEE